MPFTTYYTEYVARERGGRGGVTWNVNMAQIHFTCQDCTLSHDAPPSTEIKNQDEQQNQLYGDFTEDIVEKKKKKKNCRVKTRTEGGSKAFLARWDSLYDTRLTCEMGRSNNYF